MFRRRNVTCSKCSRSVEDEDDIKIRWFPLRGELEYGTQCFTCCNCIKHFCLDCKEDDDDGDNQEEDGDEGRFLLRSCRNCEKDYCSDCGSLEKCAKCSKSYCKGCKLIEKCGDCNGHYCKDCQSFVNCGGSSRGGRPCDKKFCWSSCVWDCADQKSKCNECEVPFCDSCLASHRCENCSTGYCRKCHGSNDMSCCDQCL